MEDAEQDRLASTETSGTKSNPVVVRIAGKAAGGERGIRTPDGVSPMPVFKTGAINHSAISPLLQFYYNTP